MEKDISRINIEQEEQWLKVKANVVNASKASLETRLRGNSALRKEVESRLNKVSVRLRSCRCIESLGGFHAGRRRVMNTYHLSYEECFYIYDVSHGMESTAKG